MLVKNVKICQKQNHRYIPQERKRETKEGNELVYSCSNEEILAISLCKVFFNNKSFPGSFLAFQWLRLHLPMQVVLVWYLVKELGSHMPCGQKIKISNRSNNKFNKDFKNDRHLKKSLKQILVLSKTSQIF